MEKRLSNDRIYKGNNCIVSITMVFPSDNVEYVFCIVLFGRNEGNDFNKNRLRNFAVHYISTIIWSGIYIFLGKVSYYIEHNISWLYILITYIFMNIPDIALKTFKKYKKGSETE
jgi:hypothetical protein